MLPLLALACFTGPTAPSCAAPSYSASPAVPSTSRATLSSRVCESEQRVVSSDTVRASRESCRATHAREPSWATHIVVYRGAPPTMARAMLALRGASAHDDDEGTRSSEQVEGVCGVRSWGGAMTLEGRHSVYPRLPAMRGGGVASSAKRRERIAAASRKREAHEAREGAGGGEEAGEGEMGLQKRGGVGKAGRGEVVLSRKNEERRVAKKDAAEAALKGSLTDRLQFLVYCCFVHTHTLNRQAPVSGILLLRTHTHTKRGMHVHDTHKHYAMARVLST